MGCLPIDWAILPNLLLGAIWPVAHFVAGYRLDQSRRDASIGHLPRSGCAIMCLPGTPMREGAQESSRQSLYKNSRRGGPGRGDCSERKQSGSGGRNRDRRQQSRARRIDAMPVYYTSKNCKGRRISPGRFPSAFGGSCEPECNCWPHSPRSARSGALGNGTPLNWNSSRVAGIMSG
jgi:hypothetical protein